MKQFLGKNYAILTQDVNFTDTGRQTVSLKNIVLADRGDCIGISFAYDSTGVDDTPDIQAGKTLFTMPELDGSYLTLKNGVGGDPFFVNVQIGGMIRSYNSSKDLPFYMFPIPIRVTDLNAIDIIGNPTTGNRALRMYFHIIR
jgi:hypothetical protein